MPRERTDVALGQEAPRSARADSAATAAWTASGTTLKIAETFTSIQGEGKLTGVPSFFIRVSGCNLRCVWCDTPYASWNPEGEVRTIDSLLDEANETCVRHVVVTGGEPMLFEPVTELTRRLKEAGLHITIETAGTIDRPVACDLMSISPKLSNSVPDEEWALARAGLAPGTPASSRPPAPDDRSDAVLEQARAWAKRHEARRINLEALQGLLDEHSDRQLKFVVQTRQDLAEIDDLLTKLRGVAPEDVMLMPEGVTPPVQEHKQFVAKTCLERGWRYCGRLHIELFGNARGT
jgi:7-carboxy-7-deazaguanine synthase